MTILQLVNIEKDQGKHNLFFSLEGIEVIKSSNKILCITCINVVTTFEMVALHYKRITELCGDYYSFVSVP